MLLAGVVDWECEFAANGDHAARDVSARYWARIPRVKQEQNSFQSDAHRIALIHHDFKIAVEITANSLDEHWIVIITRQYLPINFQQIESFAADAKELAVLIQHNRVAEAVTELHFHNG